MILVTCKRCSIKQEYINFIYLSYKKKEESIGRVCKNCKVKARKLNDIKNKNLGITKTKLNVTKKKHKKKAKPQTSEYWRQYSFNRRRTDPLFRFKDRIRSLIYCSIVRSKGYSKKSHTYEILGCSYEFFFNYIKNQFKEGMTWDNIHLDHIKPLFLGTTEEEVLILNHYTNFQPLFAIDNLRKGCKY